MTKSDHSPRDKKIRRRSEQKLLQNILHTTKRIQHAEQRLFLYTKWKKQIIHLHEIYCIIYRAILLKQNYNRVSSFEIINRDLI